MTKRLRGQWITRLYCLPYLNKKGVNGKSKSNLTLTGAVAFLMSFILSCHKVAYVNDLLRKVLIPAPAVA